MLAVGNNALLVALVVVMSIIVAMQRVLLYARQLLLAQVRIEFECEFFWRFFERKLSMLTSPWCHTVSPPWGQSS